MCAVPNTGGESREVRGEKSLIKKAARGEKWRTIQTIPKGAKKQPAAKPQKKKVKPAAKEPEPVVADESSDPDEEE